MTSNKQLRDLLALVASGDVDVDAARALLARLVGSIILRRDGPRLLADGLEGLPVGLHPFELPERHSQWLPRT